MTAQRCAIGVDLGGQSVKLALVDDRGQIVLRRQNPLDANQSALALSKLLIDEIDHLSSDANAQGHEPCGVGIGVPAQMDQDRARLLFSVNLPSLDGTSFLSDILRGVSLPVSFDADCNVAALGEYRFGAGRSIDPLIVATVGTGIGAGVISKGKPLRLLGHVSASLGHLIVDPNGPECSCGARGCVEALSSGRALEHRAADYAQQEPHSRLAVLRAKHGRLTGVEIGLALRDDDPSACRAVQETGWWLGVGVASWVAIFRPQKVLIGGGIAQLGEPFVAAVREGFRQVGQPRLTGNVVIEAADLGTDAGMIGAGALMMSA